MRTCLIVTGGDYTDLPEEIGDLCDVYKIACDSGYGYAQKMGIMPDVVLGDFDSGKMPNDTAAEVMRYPTRKDDTDTMLAVKYAISQGYSDIHIVCAFGGRMDHAFSNLQAGTYIAARGGTATLYGKNEVAVMFGGSKDSEDGIRSLKFPRKEGWSLSVFSLTERCEGVSIKGTKYEVDNVTIAHDDPVGTSNVWTKEVAEISVDKGIIMVMLSRLTPGEHI